MKWVVRLWDALPLEVQQSLFLIALIGGCLTVIIGTAFLIN